MCFGDGRGHGGCSCEVREAFLHSLGRGKLSTTADADLLIANVMRFRHPPRPFGQALLTVNAFEISQIRSRDLSLAQAPSTLRSFFPVRFAVKQPAVKRWVALRRLSRRLV